jgi:hypothetical protein
VSAVTGPLVIAGIGGSGTRVFTRIARAAGRHMGERVNESEDALELMAFADRWLADYHAARVAGAPAPGEEMRADLERSIAAHVAGLDRHNAPWGWKQPRSIHFLPFLHEALPGMRFLHVVRDGRDVAFGRQAPIVLGNAGDAVLGSRWRERPVPLALIELWSLANGLAADYGEASMGPDYLRVRFEDLCMAADPVAAQVAEFAGATDAAGEDVRRVAREVTWARSIGCWRDADPGVGAEVDRAGHAALERFGYSAKRFRRPLLARLRSATRRARRS